MRQCGVTLLELMVVMAVSAILLTVGVPSFASLVQSNRLTSATNTMVSSLQLARSEAVKRNVRTMLCPSASGIECADSAHWEHGWLVFADGNNNGVLDADEGVILWQPAMAAGIRMTGNQNVSRYISYTPTGAAKLRSGAWQFGTLTVCTHSGPARKIVVSSTGRVRSARLASCP